MDIIKTEVAIFGSGSAGLSAYRSALQYTENVLLIEGIAYGTTCARVGCMPSKLLIAAAHNAEALHKAHHFGVNLNDGFTIDGKKVMERLKAERDRFVGFVNETIEGIPEKHRLWGKASFINDHLLQVGEDKQVEAERIVIATGSRPSYPPHFSELGDRLVVNDDIFSWDDLPNSVAIFGAGVIGLELGHALKNLGVDVNMFGVRGGFAGLSDITIRDCAIDEFRSQFFLDTDADIKHMALKDNGVSITYKDKQTEKDKTIDVDYVVGATGRRPNVDNIGLENVNIALDQRGVPIVDAFTLQAGDSHIFLAGDASNVLPLLHEASDQGKIAGTNAGRFPDVRAGHRRTFIGIVFCSPGIAMVGSSYKQLLEQYGDCDCFAVGGVSIENQGRARVMLENRGMMHVYGEHGTGLFLGAEMVCPGAEHFAHLLSWCVQKKMTVCEMLDMPFYHPVLEEGLRTALRDLQANLKLAPPLENECMECGPGT